VRLSAVRSVDLNCTYGTDAAAPTRVVLTVSWGDAFALDFEAGCDDEDCEADHQPTAAARPGDLIITASAVEQGDSSVADLVGFATRLQAL
jgi:hypothetical protein